MSDLAFYPKLQNCPQASSSLYADCMPKTFDLNGTTVVLQNILSKVCLYRFADFFQSCIPLQIVQKADLCFSSFSSLQSCLPGAYSHLAEYPRTCRLVSLSVFVMNESMASVQDVRMKVVWFLAVQALRAIESYMCLPSCAANKDKTFWFLGQREYPMELERYGLSGFRSALSAVDPAITKKFSLVEKVIDHTISQFFKTIIPALIQQGLRNRDFIEAYELCSPQETKIKQVVQSYISSIFGEETSDIPEVMYRRVVSPITYALKTGATQLIHFSLWGLKETLRLAMKAGGKVLQMLWLALFQGDRLYRIVESMVHKVYENSPSLEQIEETLASWYTSFLELKAQLGELIDSLLPKWDNTKVNPFTGKTNQETFEMNPSLEEQHKSFWRSYISGELGGHELPKEAESLSKDEVKSLEEQVKDLAHDFFIALGDTESPSLL